MIFKLTDPALHRLGRIVRSADVKGVLDPDLAAWSLSFSSLRTP